MRGLVGSVPAESAEMLAGPTIDSDRLDLPRGAGARINTADVLQDVGPARRALHFDGLPVFQIRHLGLVDLVIDSYVYAPR